MRDLAVASIRVALDRVPDFRLQSESERKGRPRPSRGEPASDKPCIPRIVMSNTGDQKFTDGRDYL
jgi:hypothetical protein